MNKFRCSICGKFIGLNEFQKDEIKIEFTPASLVSYERTEYIHRKCEYKIEQDIKHGKRKRQSGSN